MRNETPMSSDDYHLPDDDASSSPDMPGDESLETDVDELIERHAGLFLAAAGWKLGRTMDPTRPENDRYYEWLARESRLSQTTAERAETERAAERFAERMTRRVTSVRSIERMTVRTMRGAPPAGIGERGDARAWDLSVAAGTGRELWDEPCTSWVRVPESVPDGRHVALKVAGDSMLPLFHDGDTILVRLGSDIGPDQVVVARHPDDGYVVKRIDRIERSRIVLTSLNDGYAPITIPHDLSLILGVVVLRWCPHERRTG
jgi:phage repressor protein C with HTH and peptisase S24 domain